jgi:hypothetical protein
MKKQTLIKQEAANDGNTMLAEVASLTRDEVVPHYRKLILSKPTDEEVKRVNQLILSKWKPSGLIYIKELAWKGL